MSLEDLIEVEIVNLELKLESYLERTNQDYLINNLKKAFLKNYELNLFDQLYVNKTIYEHFSEEEYVPEFLEEEDYQRIIMGRKKW